MDPGAAQEEPTTITLELSDEEEARLNAKAASLGVGGADYLKMLINGGSTAEGTVPHTPAEMVDLWQRSGVLGTFRDRPDSPAFARELRERASRRRWD